MMNKIARLQAWYRAQCNGDWEHRHGITVQSCDNPGWWVKVDLTGTALENKSFEPVSKNVSMERMERISKGLEPELCDQRSDWLLCEVKGKMFSGAGDPDKLEDILEVFLNWAEAK